jgi:hypothetical protein
MRIRKSGHEKPEGWKVGDKTKPPVLGAQWCSVCLSLRIFHPDFHARRISSFLTESRGNRFKLLVKRKTKSSLPGIKSGSGQKQRSHPEPLASAAQAKITKSY